MHLKSASDSSVFYAISVTWLVVAFSCVILFCLSFAGDFNADRVDTRAQCIGIFSGGAAFYLWCIAMVPWPVDHRVRREVSDIYREIQAIDEQAGEVTMISEER
jgi:hypothetical protein